LNRIISTRLEHRASSGQGGWTYTFYNRRGNVIRTVRQVQIQRTADELRAFVDQNSGYGTMYATPSEFILDLLRQWKMQLETQKLRKGVLKGLQDLADGRLTEFKGSLSGVLKKART
jgi:antitoxin ParD1/3/4